VAAKLKKPVKSRGGGRKPTKSAPSIDGVVSQEYSVVDIDSVKQHPRNARKGNLKVIEESITENRFYGAVVVQRSTGYIIAGNHRWIAAKEKGLGKIPAIFIDVDDARALKILMVDNRANDLAGYDDEALAAVLKEVARDQGGLIGTGFGDLDLARLLRQFDPAGTQPRLDLLKAYTVTCPKCGHEYEFRPKS
jgi:ParB-like chromosome segregation protein Spo0J